MRAGLRNGSLGAYMFMPTFTCLVMYSLADFYISGKFSVPPAALCISYKHGSVHYLQIWLTSCLQLH